MSVQKDDSEIAKIVQMKGRLYWFYIYIYNPVVKYKNLPGMKTQY